MSIEYRVRPIVRYIVTRHEMTENSGSTQNVGSEYDNVDMAYEVGYAVAKAEADRLKLPPGSVEVIFPAKLPPFHPEIDSRYVVDRLDYGDHKPHTA